MKLVWSPFSGASLSGITPPISHDASHGGRGRWCWEPLQLSLRLRMAPLWGLLCTSPSVRIFPPIYERLHHTSPRELVWGWQRIWSLKFREFMIINCIAECKMMFQEVPSSLDPGGHWRPESRFNLTSTRVSLSEGRYDTTMGGEGTTPSCCSFEILQNCWGTGQNQRNRRVQPEVKTFEVLSNIRSPKKIDFLY